MSDIVESLLKVPAETQTVEFKRLDGQKVVSKIAETIVAMANTDGGKIIIGIEDPEKAGVSGFERIFGIEENLELYDEVLRLLPRIIPPITGIGDPVIITVPDIDKRIAIINIPKATKCFHSFNNYVFIRLNKGNKRLSPQEIINMSYAKGFEEADKELVKVDFSLLETDLYREWKGNRNISESDIKTVLFNTGLARKNRNGTLLPTRAAVLLFAEFPTNLMDTKCTIRVLQYAGKFENYKDTPNMVAKPATIEGPLISLIEKAHDYVLTLLRSGIEIHSGFITKYQIPERAVKEAITNAVIHRDYHIKKDIEIKIFEDRIEVKNPGLFSHNITTTNIGKVRADGYRNDLLVKHLREFPQPPNLDQNEGVQAMQNVMNAKGLYPPIYWTYPTYTDAVEVGLFNEARPTEWEVLRDYLLKNKYINNGKAREVTGIVQVTKMSQYLSKWSDQGLLTKIQSGSKKFTLYKLANQEDAGSS